MNSSFALPSWAFEITFFILISLLLMIKSILIIGYSYSIGVLHQ